MDCLEREVAINSVLDSLQINPTAAAACLSECKRASASVVVCDVRVRSSAKTRSVRYLARFLELLRFIEVYRWSRANQVRPLMHSQEPRQRERELE